MASRNLASQSCLQILKRKNKRKKKKLLSSLRYTTIFLSHSFLPTHISLSLSKNIRYTRKFIFLLTLTTIIAPSIICVKFKFPTLRDPGSQALGSMLPSIQVTTCFALFRKIIQFILHLYQFASLYLP